jgi:hypothetical protein
LQLGFAAHAARCETHWIEQLAAGARRSMQRAVPLEKHGLSPHVSSAVGAADGSCVGAADGWWVGRAVGLAVGRADGDGTVGASDGAAVVGACEMVHPSPLSPDGHGVHECPPAAF